VLLKVSYNIVGLCNYFHLFTAMSLSVHIMLAGSVTASLLQFGLLVWCYIASSRCHGSGNVTSDGRGSQP